MIGWMFAVLLWSLGSLMAFAIIREGCGWDRKSRLSAFKYSIAWPLFVLGFSAMVFADWWDNATYFIFGSRE